MPELKTPPVKTTSTETPTSRPASGKTDHPPLKSKPEPELTPELQECCDKATD